MKVYAVRRHEPLYPEAAQGCCPKTTSIWGFHRVPDPTAAASALSVRVTFALWCFGPWRLAKPGGSAYLAV